MRKSHLIAGGVIAAALVIGTGVGAQAHSMLTGNDIKNGSITGADIATNSVGGGDITNGTLHAADFDPATLKALHGAAGAKGAQGAQGEQGPAGTKGETGAPGAAGKDGSNGKDATIRTYLRKVQVQIPAGQKAEGTATCDAGDVVTGGGYSSNDQTNGWSKIYQNRMTWVNTGNENTPDGWYVQALGGDRDSDVYAWAICLAA